MPINMKSIMAKARNAANSGSGKKKVNEAVDKVLLGQVRLQLSGTAHTPEEAAWKFIDVLTNAINSSGLSQNAIALLENIDCGKPYKLSDGTYCIYVSFKEDMHRESLAPGRFPNGIDDIAELLNDGVDHRMKAVRGEWHGYETWSRTVIPGTHFMEQAKADFMGNYASEYNVTNIEIIRNN